MLGVERIDHGVRCLEDPALVERLARERIALTVCPLSNVKLCVFGAMAEHNLARLLGGGRARPPSIPTIRPTSAATSTRTSLEAFAALPALGAREAYTLARNSFEASFVDDAARRAMIEQLDETFARFAA